MRIAGGKSKLGNKIACVIMHMEAEKKWQGEYFEPFCGSLNVGIHFANVNRQVLAADLNVDLILLLKAIKRGWKPPNTCCSKEEYHRLRKSTKHSALRGMMGFSCAYSAIFFAGYVPKAGKQNFYLRARTNLLKMAPALVNVDFRNASYASFHPKGMTIYADPPYIDNKFNSKHFHDFDHDKFWQTMREWSKDNLVIISEYTAPSDFKTIWSINFGSSFHKQGRQNVEKLFMYKHGI